MKLISTVSFLAAASYLNCAMAEANDGNIAFQITNHNENLCLTPVGLWHSSGVDVKPCDDDNAYQFFTYNSTTQELRSAKDDAWCFIYHDKHNSWAYFKARKCNENVKPYFRDFSVNLTQHYIQLHHDQCLASNEKGAGVTRHCSVQSSMSAMDDFDVIKIRDAGKVTTPIKVTSNKPQAPAKPEPKQPEKFQKDVAVKSNPGGRGDPHFTRFGGQHFDFHGGCTLVLLDAPGYSKGEGLTVHIRTAIKTWWSYIEATSVLIGKDILEVSGSKDGGRYWINGMAGKQIESGQSFTFAGHPVTFRKVSATKQRFRLDLGNGDSLSLTTFGDWMAVDVGNKRGKAFEGAVGLLGSFPDGQMLARDGLTEMKDNNKFGMEWQVQISEPMLFNGLGDGVHHPQQCDMPSKSTKKRRLGEVVITKELAEKACAGATVEDQTACVFDVVAANDLKYAEMYLN
ncbi:expressed unknown protein [Seminavis robusta]|uniref:VWFD domain-containing protein n=1 Tax=Seminavis robusta TaxID=568900 RepID=A0A9N8D6B9_9STRA|nr:expressed unknown protein [Seminavis robusta]|eukprot:Sro16_g011740.1 n/a (456) ;mRNA; f:90749-92218